LNVGMSSLKTLAFLTSSILSFYGHLQSVGRSLSHFLQ
jgi:hypothetical protein